MNEKNTKELIEVAPILYSGRRKPMTQSLMCFGFMCGDGWRWPLFHLSENLEGINVLVEKYGVWVEATEVKEKYGTLRFYYDVRCRLALWKRVLNWVIGPAIWFVNRVCSLVAWPFIHKKIEVIPFWLSFGESRRQLAIVRLVNNLTEKLTNNCEEECMNYCEECGNQFGTWNKNDKVETTGWIRIVCKECADKNGWSYVPFGKAWDNPPADSKKKKAHVPSEKVKAKAKSAKLKKTRKPFSKKKLENQITD